MSKASNGSQMLKDEALLLLDKNGEPIKWEENKDDGSYSAKLEEKGTTDVNGKKLPGHTYIYRIDPIPQLVNVSVVEEVEVLEQPEQAAEVKKQAEIEKSISDNPKAAKQKKF